MEKDAGRRSGKEADHSENDSKGCESGLETTWELAKVVVPTAVVVALFKASGLLESITALFAPYLSWFGLSGDAAVVLFSGYFINLYAPRAASWPSSSAGRRSPSAR